MVDLALETGIARLGDLSDPARITWAVAAGAAVQICTRGRQPTDLDVLVPPEPDLGYRWSRIVRMGAGARAMAVLANWGRAR